MGSLELHMRAHDGIGEISADVWDACANPCAAVGAEIESRNPYNPFVSHDFLSSLEESKSIQARAGWQPMHLAFESSDGVVQAVAPCYVKTHSRGEYVFDAGWAEAFERAGGQYYPKLQIAAPFTPVPGRRLLVRPGEHAETVRNALPAALIDICKRSQTSSIHVTFPTKSEWELLGEKGFLQRTGQQFHWENAGYDSFDAFLGALTSRKRKAIRRERTEARANGVTIHWLTGRDLTEAVWDAFFEFYIETGSRKWGRPYLTRSFFSIVSEKMKDRILLVMAERAGRWVAGALNFIGSDTLYGRHWGAIEHHPFLHFELCYYQAIDFAIQHKLPRVEAGAQGEHKLARGYLPTTTYSAHFIAHPGLRRAVADFLEHERAYVAEANRELSEYAPFRKDLVVETE